MDIENRFCRKITVADLAPHVHSFLPNENKVEKILNWLRDWIEFSLECRKIQVYDLLPSKADIAYHIGVSQGTIQSVFRLLEDEGFVESKQRIGTYIKDRNSLKNIVKQTSKREFAIELVKKFIIENKYKVGDILISTRKMSTIVGISNSTLRAALVCLVSLGILKKEKNNYVLVNLPAKTKEIEPETLVKKVANLIRKYVKEELDSGDKIPTSKILSKKFKVSTKTVHEAIKILVKEGLLTTRRGQYGTIVVLDSNDLNVTYFYEKFELKIRHYINENCQVGDKLPTIKDFSEKYNTSQKTIKKALDNLAEEGFIAFSMGRYGGTFVLDIPQSSAEAYRWLAINSNYF